MGAKKKAERTSRAVAEGLNCLGVLLCGPAFKKLQPDVGQVLDHWEREYAPTFREIGADLKRSGRARLVSALAALSSAARATGTPGDLAPLRSAIRDVMAALGMPLAKLSPAESGVCELHGSKCPALSANVSETASPGSLV